jgi:ubiquinone/menaquinone biosynthesis C-methylase UbiE
MLMNSIEYWAMNNPVRGFIQRHYEAPRLKRLFNGSANAILEIGCGQGVGADIICKMFGPQRYVGIDIDPMMIKRARHKGRGLKNATFRQGDASSLTFDDDTFDLAIDFGVVHHIPNWRDALAEVHRTLKIGGKFLFEELPLETWERGIGKPIRKHLEHPYEQMFRRQEFLDELEKLGFETASFEDNPVSFYYFWGKATKVS